MDKIKVVAAVIKKDDKILCMQRCRSRQTYNSERWEFPGGKVEKHECDHEALLREIKEETAIQPQRLFSADYIEQFYEPSLNVIEMIPAFVGFCAENQSVLLNHEHTEYRWCSLSEAKTLAIFLNQRKLYDFIWENFVLQQPIIHLEIT